MKSLTVRSCNRSGQAFAYWICKSRKSILGIAIFICIGWPLFVYWMDYFDPPVMVLMSDKDLDMVRNQPLKKILYWNAFFDQKDYFFGFGTQPFTNYNCNVTCETTDDRDQYNTSDAIIFHIQTQRVSDMPKYRFPHLRWVFYMLESPDNTKPYNKLRFLNYTFNWTMTYRLDSDVPLLYGSFSKRHESLPKSALSTDNFQDRTKSVMWVVSECSTWGRRELYVRELSKYIDVDIYGDCGQSCRVDDQLDACETIYLSTYKFYLAFENSLCKDYNTEKFYRGGRKHGPIPIVFGSSNYSAIAPPKYFIDVRDFGSPKELANFLKVLSNDADMYNKYFEWRADYVVNYDGVAEGFCKLCQKLHSPMQIPSEYPDMYNWWIVKGNCEYGDGHKANII